MKNYIQNGIFPPNQIIGEALDESKQYEAIPIVHQSTYLDSELPVVGRKYILDKNFNNCSTVKVTIVYGKIFCRVQCLESKKEWDTMCNRLFDPEFINKPRLP